MGFVGQVSKPLHGGDDDNDDIVESASSGLSSVLRSMLSSVGLVIRVLPYPPSPMS